jgi:glycosyltransferase Alg8
MLSALSSVARALEVVFAHGTFLLLVSALVLIVPPSTLEELGRSGVLALGLIATWRYGWALTHLIRSLIYRHYTFPRWRRNVDALAHDHDQQAFFLVTSFRIGTDTTIRVYRAVFEAALAYPGPSTVVASVVEMGDQRLIKSLFQTIVRNQGGRIKLRLVRIAGTGKRDALAFGFRAIADAAPYDDDIVMVIDGDSIVPRDLVSRCAPLLRLNPNVGGLTTDEEAEVQGRPIFQHWYALRFAQRHILMSSMGLARRVLTLTGRMSMLRASIVSNPDFIRQVEVDYVDHWRLGRVKLLTGDDKSTWFWLLKNGYEMLYVPDVVVRTIEELPSENFFEASTTLMVRWFGNMLRTNARAIQLGPRRIGLFTWWSVIDQRISMWTSLTGFVFALLGTLFITPFAGVIYIAWILASRYVLTLLLLTSRDRVSLWYPFLLWYNQVVGSFVKTFIFAHMSRQRWTRQKTTLSRGVSRAEARLHNASSVYMHVLTLGALFAAVAAQMGLLPIPLFLSLD